jgi:hypothetical protein
MVLQGGLYLAGRQSTVSTILLGVVAGISGVSLITGILTPVAGALAGAGTLGCYLGWLPWPAPNLIDATLPAMLVVLVSAALVLLGPGALSLDARLFGKHEVIIPRRRRMPED